MPVSVVAEAALVFTKVWIVLCVTVLFTELLTNAIPTTDAAVVVPVPPAAERFRTVLSVTVASEVERKIPATWLPVAEEVLCNEFATVPPTVLFWIMEVTVVDVFNRIPYTFAAL